MNLSSQFLKANSLPLVTLWSNTPKSLWSMLQQSLEAEVASEEQLPNYTDAIVVEMISPELPGRVKYQGSWWRAISCDDRLLLPSTPVFVTGRIGLTLIVTPVEA
jgi:membrane protein implicated in regulation of membrane protease activity